MTNLQLGLTAAGTGLLFLIVIMSIFAPPPTPVGIAMLAAGGILLLLGYPSNTEDEPEQVDD